MHTLQMAAELVPHSRGFWLVAGIIMLLGLILVSVGSGRNVAGPMGTPKRGSARMVLGGTALMLIIMLLGLYTRL